MLKLKQKFMSACLTLAMLVSCMPMMAAHAETTGMIARAEFDGTDDGAHWKVFGDNLQPNNIVIDKTSTLIDSSQSLIKFANANVGYGTWGMYFGTGNEAYQIAQTKKNIVFKLRFKADRFSDNYQLFSLFAKRIKNDGAVTDDSQEFFNLSSYDGKLTMNKNGSPATYTQTGYALSVDTWYNIDVRVDYEEQKAYVNIADDAGNKGGTYTIGFINGSAYKFENLTQICTMRTAAGGTFCIDYLRAYDEDLMPVAKISYDEGKNPDGVSGIANGTEFSIDFENAITEADMADITIDGGAELSKTLSADGKTVTAVVSKLAYGTQYTLTVPAIGMNLGKSVTFFSAVRTGIITSSQFDGKDDMSKWAVFDSSYQYNPKGTFDNSLVDVTNGYAKYNRNNVGYGAFGIFFGTGDDAYQIDQTKENIIVKMRFKADTYINRDILALNGKKLNDNGTTNLESFYYFKMAYEGGKLKLNDALKDYSLSGDTWYSVELRADYKAKKTYVNISDDNGNSGTYTEGFLYNGTYVNLTQICTMKTEADGYFYLDYLEAYDEDLLPVASISYDGGKPLDGASGIKNGATFTVGFEDAITEADMAKITIDGGAELSKTLSEDGKTVTAVMSKLSYRTKYTVTVPAIGVNLGKSAAFFTAEEEKYLFRAEFDGADDISKWYKGIGGNKFKIEDQSMVSDGNCVMTWGNFPYRSFDVIFDEDVSLEGKKNILYKMRFKYDNDGTLSNNFLSIIPNETSGGESIFALKIQDGNKLYYGSEYANYIFEANKWYTVTVKMNFASHKYSLILADDAGNIATTPETNFTYNANWEKIRRIQVMQKTDNKTPTQYIDYIYLWDGDYGKAEVTYGSGYPLENAALVPVSGNTFTVTLSGAPETKDGISITDENGNSVEATILPYENVLTVIPGSFEYNTKYTMTIPKDVLGMTEDQVIHFRTEWNQSKEFVMPEIFKDKENLSVAFFGGSITNQEGWRVHVTNQIKEWFPNAECHNCSVGGTGSQYGWRRLERDVISKSPDLVFVEFSVNDANFAETAKYMESIVRNLNKLEKRPVIIFVYTMVQNFETNSWSIAEHEKIAKAYGIPTINIRDYMRTLYNQDITLAGEWDTFGKFFTSPDTTHPTAEGSRYYGEYVNNLLTHDSEKYFVLPKENSAVTPLTDFKDYTYDFTALSKKLTENGEQYEFTFKGDEVVLEYALHEENAGIFSLTVDGVVVGEAKDTFLAADSSLYDGYLSRSLYSGLGEGTHTAVVTVTGKNAASAGYTVDLKGIFTPKEKGVEFGELTFNSSSVTASSTLTAQVYYVGHEAKKVTIAIALYDENSRLIDVTSAQSITDSSGKDKSISLSVKPGSDAKKAKAFLWDSKEGMTPVIPNASVGF